MAASIVENSGASTGYTKDDLASAKAFLLGGGNFAELSEAQQNAIEAEYNFVTSIIMNDTSGDLIRLFTNAVKNGWDPQRFRLEAEKTKWFSEKNASQEWFLIQNDGVAGAINMEGRKAKDLLEARGNIFQEVKNYALTMLGANADDPATKAKLDQVTDDILMNGYLASGGWQSTVSVKVANAFKGITTKDLLGGSLGKTISDVTSLYRGLGLMLDENQATKYAQGILNGTTNIDTITQGVRKNSAQMWSQFSDRILAGESLQNILYPYTQLIGSMLEVDPDQLDFTVEDPTKPAGSQIDPLLQSALFSSADKTGLMSLTDLRKSIKKDSRWQYTKNAEAEYASITKELMRTFGAGV